jgi:hypothetical protein
LQDYAEHLSDADFVVNDKDSWMKLERIGHLFKNEMPDRAYRGFPMRKPIIQWTLLVQLQSLRENPGLHPG